MTLHVSRRTEAPGASLLRVVAIALLAALLLTGMFMVTTSVAEAFYFEPVGVTDPFMALRF
ncbi:MAG: hypothetical protein H7Y88_12920 [Phycisphaerales bacterium]|nr:hypothetical protein [Phycisphaerales bacterium]